MTGVWLLHAFLANQQAMNPEKRSFGGLTHEHEESVPLLGTTTRPMVQVQVPNLRPVHFELGFSE